MARQSTETTVWTASVAEALALPTAIESLGEGERTHAQRFRLPADRDRFIAARALLRHALSDTVGDVTTGEWRYRDGPNGKPAMAAGLPPVEFNISHSADCVAVGISLVGPIGVDVERLSPGDCSQIVEDVLTIRERDALRRCAVDERSAIFLRLWTAKEACAKAVGLGVALDFRNLEVGIDRVTPVGSDELVGRVEVFDIASTRVGSGGGLYVVSVARVAESAVSNSFRFKVLKSHSAAALAPRSVGLF
jgi:4'-phosphopantetheinyl transferase